MICLINMKRALRILQIRLHLKLHLDFVNETGKEKIRKHEDELLMYATSQLEANTRVKDHWKSKRKNKSGFIYH